LFLHKDFALGTITEVLIYTWQNPRVLPLVTGVMLCLDINILSMENFVQNDGHILIKMRIQDRTKQPLSSTRVLGRIEKNLNDVFMGRSTVSTLLAKHRRPSFLQKKTIQQSKWRIQIDNDVSAYYTVIDIYTYDRLGLLYDTVTCLVDQGCYLDVSKISTNVDQVIDSFYVKDIFGHKIRSKQKLKEIREALIQVIDI